MNQQPASRQTRIQEEEYTFPYHYIADFPPRAFRQHLVDRWGINYVSTIDHLLNRISAGGHDSLVDIGCGDGRLTREVALRTEIARVCGVDTSERAVQLAQAMNTNLDGIEFNCADIITSNRGLRDFDAAVLMEVLEHIPPWDASRFLQAVREMLRPGGRLYLTVPHANKPVEPKHHQHFTVASLAAFIEPHFEISRVQPFERRGWRRQLLNRLLCNRVFVLNNARMLNFLYDWHRKSLFLCENEGNCQRIYMEAVAL